MINYISGTLKGVSTDSVVVDNNGMGYLVSVSAKTLEKLPPVGEQVCVYTYMSVSENAVALYGFSSEEELRLFNMIINVSGIGPKGALGILGTVSPSQFIMAVLTDDIKTLSTAPGIGKKTAQRLVLELKDKLNSGDALESAGLEAESVSVATGEKEEAVLALAALGFGKAEAVNAVNAVYTEGMTAEKTISLSLKVLSR